MQFEKLYMGNVRLNRSSKPPQCITNINYLIGNLTTKHNPRVPTSPKKSDMTANQMFMSYMISVL